MNTWFLSPNRLHRAAELQVNRDCKVRNVPWSHLLAVINNRDATLRTVVNYIAGKFKEQ
jgi:hypothetical protein